MSQELTLNLLRPQGSNPAGDQPSFGQGALQRRMERLLEVARAEHARLATQDAERELRERANRSGQ